MASRQDVRFCTAADGTRIAVASIGSGPPLVRAAHWLSHVERDLESPVWRPWVQELSRHHTYIRYDQRCCSAVPSGMYWLVKTCRNASLSRPQPTRMRLTSVSASRRSRSLAARRSAPRA